MEARVRPPPPSLACTPHASSTARHHLPFRAPNPLRRDPTIRRPARGDADTGVEEHGKGSVIDSQRCISRSLSRKEGKDAVAGVWKETSRSGDGRHHRRSGEAEEIGIEGSAERQVHCSCCLSSPPRTALARRSSPPGGAGRLEAQAQVRPAVVSHIPSDEHQGSPLTTVFW
ncbi:unnamed protein product [Urochloa humidicola]